MNGTFKIAVVALMGALFALGHQHGGEDTTFQRVQIETGTLVEQPIGMNAVQVDEQVRS